MSVSTQSAQLVRQKAYAAVYGGGTSTVKISPYHFYAIKAFFLHMSANKNNPDLQFLVYDNSTNSGVGCRANGGVDLVGAACTLYLWFGSAQRTSGTTPAFQAIHDASDNSATTTTVWTARIDAAAESFLFVDPNGLPLATGLTISSATAVGGATETVAAADATNGFIIIGAA